MIKDAQPDDPQDFSSRRAAASARRRSCSTTTVTTRTPSNAHTFTACRPGRGYSGGRGGPPGWFLSSATCSDGSPPSNISVSPGEIVHCSFTNRKRGSITIVQDTQPDDPQDFSFTTGGASARPRSSSTTTATTRTRWPTRRCSRIVAPGNYFVNQTRWRVGCARAPPARTVRRIDQHLRLSRASTSRAPSSTPRGRRIIVRKDARPNNSQDFDFTAGGGLSPSRSSSTTTQRDQRLGQQPLVHRRPGQRLFSRRGASAGRSGRWHRPTCNDGSPISNIDVRAGRNGHVPFVNTAQIANYPRPKGATPLRVPLGPGLQPVHRPQPHARPAAGVPVLQPAGDRPRRRSRSARPDANGAAANFEGMGAI